MKSCAVGQRFPETIRAQPFTPGPRRLRRFIHQLHAPPAAATPLHPRPERGVYAASRAKGCVVSKSANRPNPEGISDNSPRFQPWVGAHQEVSPEGTAEGC